MYTTESCHTENILIPLDASNGQYLGVDVIPFPPRFTRHRYLVAYRREHINVMDIIIKFTEFGKKLWLVLEM